MQPEKTGKKRTFFSTVFRGFSGGFSGDFREIFFGKNPNFAQFYPNFTWVYPAPQSAFWEKPQIYRNLSGNFPNSENPGKKISRNSRKFRPSCFFGKFSGFSGISGILENAGTFLKYGGLCIPQKWHIKVYFKRNVTKRRTTLRYVNTTWHCCML